ncbi:hypothetical protein BDV93DRAFT_604686 [Ceratobasidium sp. AG-I]|nr:hypothetical protein BDV93DRAFT_604686 [Ceratobasidium sp. AG-I]
MRPGPRQTPDPQQKAKRKHLLATEFVNTGAHGSIKKNIKWSEIATTDEGRYLATGTGGGGKAGEKRVRLSTSQSQTPGLSDKSYTPTPAVRGALSAGGMKRSSLSGGAGGSERVVRKEVMLVSPPKGVRGGASGSQPVAKMPSKSTPAPKKTQSLPEFIVQESEVDDEASYHPPTNTTTTTTTSGRVEAEDEEPSAKSTPNPARTNGKEREKTPVFPSSPERGEEQGVNEQSAEEQPMPSPELGEAPLHDEVPPPEEDSVADDPPSPFVAPASQFADAPSQSHLNGSSQPSKSQSRPQTQPPETPNPGRRSSSPPDSSPSPASRHPRSKAQAGAQWKNRRRSSIGIQTLPDNEVEWVAGLDVDASMSAVDVSRVWLGSSPVKRGSGVGATEVEDEEEEEEEDSGEGRVLAGLDGEEERESEGEEEEGENEEGENEDEAVGGEEREAEHSERGVSVNPFDVGRHEQPEEELPAEQGMQVQPDEEPQPEVEEEQEEEEHVSATPSQATTRHRFSLSVAEEEVSETVEPEEPAPELPGTFPHDASSSRRSSSTPAGPFGVDLNARVSALRASVSQLGVSHVKPFPFMLHSQERVASDVARSAAEAAMKASTTNGNGAEPRPTVPSVRSSTRHPTPLPAPRSKPLVQELRAAPTLGRSLVADANPPGAPAGAKELDAAEKATVETGMEESPRALRAAPTLGRSMDAAASEWKAAWTGKGKAADTGANVKDNKVKGVEMVNPLGTDYDAEYGSVPDIPSSLPWRPSQSVEPGVINMTGSPDGTWRLEPTQASTPQPFRTQIPDDYAPFAAGHAMFREQEEAESSKPRPRRRGLEPSPSRPTSIATLKRRRRSSGPGQSHSQPLPASKKVRREYDMPESTAVPRDTRAHKDAYDDDGHRTWIPSRPEMQRAPEGAGVRKVVGPKYVPPSAEASEAETGEVIESAVLGGGQQELEWEPAPEPEPEPEPEVHEADKTVVQPEADLTEVAETPQIAPVELVEYSPGHGSPIARRVQEQPMLSDVPEHDMEPPALAVEPPTPVNEQPAPDLQPSSPIARPSGSVLRSREPSGEPPLIRFSSSRRSRSKRSSFRPERTSLEITPARSTIRSAPRTRLSLGGRSGPAVLEVGESDQEILQQAGLKPTLRRLSHAHGFTTDVVAEVYHEQGSLKETEEILKEMNRSANAARAKIVRRKSLKGAGLEVLQGRERDLESTGDEEEGDFRQWNTARTNREILFGSRV